MRLSVLAVSLILLFSQTIAAQHSSGGGGSSGSSAGSSAGSSSGGFHGGGYSGGGSSGGYSGSHSSGSGGSVAHGSSAHNSSAGSTAHSNIQTSRTNSGRPTHVPGGRVPANGTVKGQGDKRSFFSWLRHPFRKSQPKPVLDRRFCREGWCRACPAGQVYSGGRCAGTLLERRTYSCSSRQVWSGDACLQQTYFLDACSWERAQLARQAQRMQAANSERQNACTAAVTQECSELTSKAQNEARLYAELLERLRRCEQASYATHSYGGYWLENYSRIFDPLW